MHLVTLVLDTGARPNLVIQAFIPPDWARIIKPVGDPGFTTEGNTSVRVDGLIFTHVRMGNEIFWA